MRNAFHALAVTAAFVALSAVTPTTYADRDDDDDRDEGRHHQKSDDGIQLGPRPFYLVQGMDNGPLKDRLMQCKDGPFFRTDFSIGHRGAALQFPEHTKEAYEAGARMGAGIVECDVTFTNDGHLVCRHDECDLHTTTNIVTTPLNQQCTVPWSGPNSNPRCCTSDISLAQFRTLTGKMDASNPSATTAEGFLGGTASWRTDLYTGRGTLLTLRESIRLNQKLGVKHTPELKPANQARIKPLFGNQAGYAQAMIDELRAADVKPRDAFPQSFNVNDVLYWINNTAYGRQAVFLVDYDDVKNNIILFDTNGKQLESREDQLKFFQELRKAKVRIVAPAMPALLAVDGNARVVPSQLARDLKAIGFDIITWTFERSDLRRGASKAGFYFDFDSAGVAIKKDSDMYEALDVLARQVRILGIFSDWPATVTYYANCMGLK